MNPRHVIGGLLLLVALAGTAHVFLGGASSRPGEVPLDAPVNGVVPGTVVAYFYGGIRCDTCEKLEAYAADTVRSRFAGEVASGRLAWRTFDMDRPDNTALVTRFGLYTKSVVLVSLEAGKPVRWKNLERIWDLVHDREAYQRYIEDSLRAFLREGRDE